MFVMERLTTRNVEQLRAAGSAPITSGIAPATPSELFKSPWAKAKPKSGTLSHHFSIESQSFGGSRMKKAAAVESGRKMIRLGVGRPNAELYPWSSATFDLSGYARQIESAAAKHMVQRQHDYDIATALNYSNAIGSPGIVRFLTEHVEIVHNPPYSDWGICVTCGSTSSLETALRVFCNPGETILCEMYTYPGFHEVAALLGVYTHGVPLDSDELDVGALNNILTTWDASKAQKPKLLYIIPSGQNPTGHTLSTERRKAIYEIAQKHDLVIIEDDPYLFLQLGPAVGGANDKRVDGEEEYLASLPQSLLSLDHCGRVIRLDSAAKILSPGLRAGWVTASSEIIAKFVAYNETDAISASGPSQLMLYDLFEHSWGHRGFLSWLATLSDLYRRRRDVMQLALEKYLPPELCHWIPPRSGMFFWVHLNLDKHPRFCSHESHRNSSFTVQASNVEARIATKAFKNGVQVEKGSTFSVKSEPRSKAYLRLTYAAAAESDLQEGVKVIADAIKDEFSC